MTTENKLTPEEAKDLYASLTEEAKENWRDRGWRDEMAAVMTEAIDEGFETENLVELMAETEVLGWEDRSFVNETKGMRAFWLSRGGYIEESTIHEETFEIERDMVGFHVSEMEDKMKANFGPTQARLLDLAQKRLSAEINLKVLRTFQVAVPNTSPYYTSASGLSLATINTALREVMDEQNSEDVVIIGRRTMTDLIVDAISNIGGTGAYGAFTPQTNEELLRRGVLGSYRGANILTLKNFKDDTGEGSMFPANELWIAGKGASKFAFWGGGDFKEYTEDDNWFWHYIYRREFGGVVYRPERLRRIIDADQDA